jgi:CheY-like chemotaxis protein
MKRQYHTILVIDDNTDDLVLIKRALRKNSLQNPVHLLQSGPEAIAYLNREGKYADRRKYELPSFIITDLRLPGMDGFAIIRALKSHPEWAVIPIIILSI